MKCNMCGVDMSYGGYGVCTDCYIIIEDIKETKFKLLQWSEKGYGSVEKCVDYMIKELVEFKKEYK